MDLDFDLVDDRDDFQVWLDKRNMVIEATVKAGLAPTGLPSSVMHTPDGLSEEQRAAFRAARARWVAPPDGWEKHIPTESAAALAIFDLGYARSVTGYDWLQRMCVVMGGSFKAVCAELGFQLWDVECLRHISGYDFLGALVIRLGGRPKTVCAALGLQFAPTDLIQKKQTWMFQYREEMARIDKEFGLDTVDGMVQQLLYEIRNARTPDMASNARQELQKLKGMIVRRSASLRVNAKGGPVTDNDVKAAQMKASENWWKTVGLKCMMETAERRKALLSENTQWANTQQPTPSDPPAQTNSNPTSTPTGT